MSAGPPVHSPSFPAVTLLLSLLGACAADEPVTAPSSRRGIFTLRVAEQPASSDALVAELAARHLALHGDTADQIVFWFDEDLFMPASFYVATRNATRGLGLPLEDDRIFGTERLLGLVTMGAGWTRTTDDDAGVVRRLAQETAHAWGAHLRFRTNAGQNSSALLGREQSHWGFGLDTGGSPLGGNAWVALGGGRYRASPPREVRYAPLDLYLMGILPQTEVPPVRLLTLVSPCPVCRGDTTDTEVVVEATEETIPIERIVEATGPRTPARFAPLRQAWVLVSRETPSATRLRQLERLQERWITTFAAATGSRWSVETAEP